MSEVNVPYDENEDLVAGLQQEVERLEGEIEEREDRISELESEVQALRDEVTELSTNVMVDEAPAPVGDAQLQNLAGTVRTAMRNGHPDAGKHLDSLLNALGAK